MKITYVTGNKAKVGLAKQFLGPLGFEIDNKKIECPEIQADTFEEVSKYSSKYASDVLKSDVLKNDSGLVIEALNGFPGVYTHYVEDTLGEDGILKLMEGKENRKAYFVECLSYCKYGEEPICFYSKTYGKIAHKKIGTEGWSYDFIFIPECEEKTLACFNDEKRYSFWDNSAYLELADYLKNLK